MSAAQGQASAAVIHESAVCAQALSGCTANDSFSALSSPEQMVSRLTGIAIRCENRDRV